MYNAPTDLVTQDVSHLAPPTTLTTTGLPDAFYRKNSSIKLVNYCNGLSNIGHSEREVVNIGYSTLDIQNVKTVHG